MRSKSSFVDLRTAVRVISVFALLGLCACAPEPEPPRPNVIIITVDTLRADRMPFNGSPLNTAPFLDELSRRSLVFENAWSPSSWTLPSAVSVVTSVHPFQHGVTNLVGLELAPDEDPVPINCIPADVETLAETLGAAGYRTYGIVSNILVGAEVAFDRGFDRFVKLPDKDADAVNAVAESWREEMLEGGPFFFYVHYFDPHDTFHAREPWFAIGRPPEETGWSEEFSEQAVDPDQLDWFMTRLEPLPDGFAGRGAREFSPSEVRRLLAWSKAAYDSEIGFVDSRIREIFEMLRQPVFGILEGKSGQHELDADLRSIIVGDHRLIAQDGGRVELYDLANDPLERIDLADELPDVVAKLLRELDGIERSAPRYTRTTRLPPPPDEAMLEHLRGIGYLGK